MIEIKNKSVRSFLNRYWKLFSGAWIAFPPVPGDKRILFFKRDRNDFFYLSNFYPCQLEIDGTLWPHVEAYYQAQKSENPKYQARILEKDKAWWAKHVGDSRIGDPKIARKSWFRKHPDDLREDWDDIKPTVMRKALFAKFTQNRNLKKALIQTCSAEIVEDSPKDSYWGIGSDGTGQNRLGKMLMQVRGELGKLEESV